MSANRLFGFTRCKGTTKFADVQENSEKIAIFWIMDAHEGYGTAFRLLEMGQYSYGMPILIYRVSNVYLSYMYRISTVIDSGEIGFSAAKVLLFIKPCNRLGCLYC